MMERTKPLRRALALSLLGLAAGLFGFFGTASLMPGTAEAQTTPGCPHMGCFWDWEIEPAGEFICIPWAARACEVISSLECVDEVCEPQ